MESTGTLNSGNLFSDEKLSGVYKNPPVEKNDSFLTTCTRLSWIILFLAAFFQCVFFGTAEVIVLCFCVAFAWFILTKIFFQIKILQHFPLSSWLIIGFTLTQFYFPLIFTLLEGKPITFNLQVPYEVFLHATLELIILVVVHYFYRSVYRNEKRGGNSILIKRDFFKPPTAQQMWIMGFLGLISMFYVYVYSAKIGAGSNEDTAGAASKFIQGFIPFTYSPFFIPLGKLYGRPEIKSKNLVRNLILFTVVLFLVSIGRNSRGSFMLGFTGIAFSYGLGLLLNFYKPQFFTVRNLIIGLIGFWFFTGPMADLAIAMVIVRAQRSNVNRSELVSLTWKAFQDKAAIKKYREEGKEQKAWDESYLDDVFLSRFCNLKYSDLSLIQADKIGKPDAEMYEFSKSRFFATLPAPIINAIGIKSDKLVVNGASFGDFLYYRAGAGSGVLGGFRSGSFAGTGMATFGWWYLLIFGLSMAPAFIVFDKLVITKTVPDLSQPGKKKLLIRFSFFGLSLITIIFQFLPVESVVTLLSFDFRGWLQLLFLYYLIFKFTAFIAKTFLSKGSDTATNLTGRYARLSR